MSNHLTLQFKRMGAEIDVVNDPRLRSRFVIDVLSTKEGEKFLITGRDLGKEDIKILSRVQD